MKRRPKPLAALIGWAAVLTALGVVDYLLDGRHNGTTLSEVTRDQVFRVDTPLGRLAFNHALDFGTEVFRAHILKEVTYA